MTEFNDYVQSSRQVIHEQTPSMQSFLLHIETQVGGVIRRMQSCLQCLHAMSPRTRQDATRAHDRGVIPWIRSPFIQHFHRLAAQPRKLPLEAQIADPAHLVAIIILHEQRQAVSVPKEGALYGNLLDIRRLGQGQSLRRMGVGGG